MIFFLKLYYLHLSHDTHMVKHTVYFELFCFFFVRFLLFHLKCLHLVSRVGIESYYTVRESSNFLPCGLYLPLTLLLMHTMLDPSTYLNLVTKENLCLFQKRILHTRHPHLLVFLSCLQILYYKNLHSAVSLSLPLAIF